MRLTLVRPAWFFLMAVGLLSTVIAGPKYYPQPSSEPLQVGTEDYRESFMTLRRLEGVHVDFNSLKSTAEKFEIALPTTLYKEARQIIESAGLLYLSRDEMLTTPGLPVLNLWPSYDDEANNNESCTQEQIIAGTCDICNTSLWAGFEQSATILRQPENQYKLATWGSGDKTKVCENRGDWMAAAVLKQLNNFVADFKKAQRDLEPVTVDTTKDVPQHCSQSWVTHLNVFAANEAKINDSIKPMLDKFRHVVARCNTYSYIIETHADQRADAGYNRLLTEARARSIKDYLISQGVEHQRVHMRPLGESAPIATGTSEEDHAKNRRVVIIPLSQQEIANAELQLD